MWIDRETPKWENGKKADEQAMRRSPYSRCGISRQMWMWCWAGNGKRCTCASSASADVTIQPELEMSRETYVSANVSGSGSDVRLGERGQFISYDQKSFRHVEGDSG